jgi:Tol biopolymer transport system component
MPAHRHPSPISSALAGFAFVAGLALPTLAVAQPVEPPATTPTDAPVDDGSGLYVIVEATSRPLDALLVLPPTCTLPKASCDLVENVLANDTRLSGILRPLRGNPGMIASLVKSAPPNLDIRRPAAQGTGAQYVLATVLKPSKTAGLVTLTAGVVDVRDGKRLDLGSWAVQEAPSGSLRSMAHRVMNAVHGALTGVEGSFDTLVFYSAPGPGCDRCIWQVEADGFNRRIIVGDKSIHMFPVQFLDGSLAYTSFRTDMPSLFKLDLAQLNAIADFAPVVPKKNKGKGKKAAAAPIDPLAVPQPFASGEDLQFRGCAQNVNGDIVATINDGDQADIWQLAYDGSPSRNLTRNEADDLGASYSPDGSQIAFVSDRTGSPQIYVMNADGSDQRRLTFVGPYNSDPDWGHGGKIAFSGLRGSAIDILTVDLQGRIQRLTPGMGKRSLEPSWSPDGKRLVYSSNEDGKGYRLWVTSHDGASREPLDVPAAAGYYTPSWQRIPGKAPKAFTGH